jgi:hypothetical protein
MLPDRILPPITARVLLSRARAFIHLTDALIMEGTHITTGSVPLIPTDRCPRPLPEARAFRFSDWSATLRFSDVQSEQLNVCVGHELPAPDLSLITSLSKLGDGPT